MIPFNKPCLAGVEKDHILKAMSNSKICGDGEFTKNCHKWFEQELNCNKVLLTPSCTHALEMCAVLLDIKEGDEVIMPSYTFVSTANAFVLRGAKIVFVDIRSDTMNIDENKIEYAITSKTKAIVVVHYAGVSCDMDTIMNIARKKNIFVIEDAAQGMMSKYKDKYLGTIADLGTFSFHETKNYTSAGEGGLLIINNKDFIKRAQIIREKGTNRSAFLKGEVDKYSWVDIGSSYLLNDISAAYLWGQLQNATLINDNRLNSWNIYYNELIKLEEKGLITLPKIPSNCKHNSHMFYIKVKDLETRTNLIQYLKIKGIHCTFHYVPLHSSIAGKRFGIFNGDDKYTTSESNKLIRLPLYYNIEHKTIDNVVYHLREYFNK